MKQFITRNFFIITSAATIGIVIGTVETGFSPPPGKTSLEWLGAMFLLFFMMIACCATIIGFMFALHWLLAKFHASPTYQVVYDDTPDRPVSFGYKCFWITIKSGETEQIADLLSLDKKTPCNWKAGIDNGYLYGDGVPVFLSPPVRGWSFLVGRCALPDPETHHDELVELLNRLSKNFGEACFFGTIRTTGFAAWFRSQNGQIVRKFMYADEVIYDEGNRIGIESDVAYIDHDFDSEKEKSIKRAEFCGDENWVIQIAADWTIDPSTLEYQKKTPKAVGILGYLPNFVRGSPED